MITSIEWYFISLIKIINLILIFTSVDAKSCSECSSYSSNAGSRRGQYVGSVLTASLDEKWTSKPTPPLIGMSGGYKVMNAPEKMNYGSIHFQNVKHSTLRRKPILRERYHPTTFEAGSSDTSQNSFDGTGQVLQSAPSSQDQIILSSDESHNSFEGAGEVLQSGSSEIQTGAFQDTSSENGYGFGGYGYPYPGYQQPLPFITEAPPTGKQQDTAFGYYYIGRKLWYIPLYFSIYFVLYVGALIIKAVARHKINFPQNLTSAITSSRSTKQSDNLLAAIVNTAIEKFNSRV